MKLSIEHIGKRYRGHVWGLRDFNLELGPCVYAQQELKEETDANNY